jgi:hypothetical protein
MLDEDSKICTNRAGGRRERLIADLLRLQFVENREHQRPLIIANLHVLYNKTCTQNTGC